MIYSISGNIHIHGDDFVVLETGGLGFGIHTTERIVKELSSKKGAEIRLLTHLYVRENALELYGFLKENELRFFKLLINVSGVGPKSALSILNVADILKLMAAIQEGRSDLLTRASGIGRKTAERIIVELRGKVETEKSAVIVARMEGDEDVIDALVGLGYRRADVLKALSGISNDVRGIEARLKEALRALGRQAS